MRPAPADRPAAGTVHPARTVGTAVTARDAPDADVTGIVLAGGSSRRFGGDKLAAVVEGRPLLDHVLAGLATVCPVLVVAVGADGRLPGSVSPPVPWRAVRDPVADGGPLIGLAAALDIAESPWALVVAGDMPRPRPPVLRALLDAARAAPADAAVLLERGERRPLPAAIRVGAARRVASGLVASGQRSLTALFDALPTVTLPETAWRALDPRGESLLDVDTRADLERLGGHRPR